MKRLVALGAALAGVVAAGAGYLRATVERGRAGDDQAALERAVAAVDRELAADLELTTMFDQTKQAFVMENGQFLAARDDIARLAPEAYALVADLYERIPAMETAMERRGPAGSIPDADLAVVHAWEGDAREAQRALRSALAAPRVARWRLLLARLHARLPAR